MQGPRLFLITRWCFKTGNFLSDFWKAVGPKVNLWSESFWSQVVLEVVISKMYFRWMSVKSLSITVVTLSDWWWRRWPWLLPLQCDECYLWVSVETCIQRTSSPQSETPSPSPSRGGASTAGMSHCKRFTLQRTCVCVSLWLALYCMSCCVSWTEMPWRQNTFQCWLTIKLYHIVSCCVGLLVLSSAELVKWRKSSRVPLNSGSWAWFILLRKVLYVGYG